MRRLAQSFGLPAEELVADAARRGEDAVIADLHARLGDEAEVQRTWGQTRGQVCSDLLRRLRADA